MSKQDQEQYAPLSPFTRTPDLLGGALEGACGKCGEQVYAVIDADNVHLYVHQDDLKLEPGEPARKCVKRG